MTPLSEAVNCIKQNLGVPWNERTYRDTFKAGNQEAEVKVRPRLTFMAYCSIFSQRAYSSRFEFRHHPRTDFLE